MNKSEEEQLLQDASTLLMFANVAAKQQQQHPPTSMRPEAMPMAHQNTPTVAYRDPYAYQSVASSAQPLPIQQKQPQSHQPSHTQSTHKLVHSQSQAVPNRSGSAKSVSIESLTDPIPVVTPNAPPSSTIGIPSHLPAVVNPDSKQTLHSSGLAPVSQLMIKPTVTKPNYKSILNPENSPPSTYKSPSSQNVTPSQEVQSKQPSKAYYFPQASTDQPVERNKHNSIHQLPVSSTFTHRRTPSNGYRHSPGPASITLAGGIHDTGSSQRSNNAIIAAAALAAAADMPLPLLKKGPTPSTNQDNNQKLGEALKLQDNSNCAEPKKVIKKELSTEEPNLIHNLKNDSTKLNSSEFGDQTSQTKATTDKPFDKTSDTPTAKLIPIASVIEGSSSPSITNTNNETETETETETESKSKSKHKSKPKTNATTQSAKQSPSNDDELIPDSNGKASFIVPPLKEYKVDPDSGLIGCICGIEDDDGFTVQCDICFRWQHCFCMNFTTNEQVPDEYKCYYCDESKWGEFDADKCRADTIARLESEKNPDEMDVTPVKKDAKRKSSSGSADSSKKRKLSEGKGKKKDDSDKSPEQLQTENNSKPISLPNFANDQLEGGMCVESYQGTYYKLRANDYKTQEIRQFFESIDVSLYKDVEVLNKSEYQKKYLPIFSKKLLPKFDSNDNVKMKQDHLTSFDTYIQVKPYSENQKQKFNGIPKLGLFLTSRHANYVVPSGTPIIEYLGELSLFKNYVADKINQYKMWGTVKPRVLQTKLSGLNSPMDDIDIISDARFVGNEARFIRNACPSAANCTIKPIYLKDQRSFKFLVVTSRPIHLKDEDSEEELRLEWQWSTNHPIKKMYDRKEGDEIIEGMKFDQFSESARSELIGSIDNVLNFVECACSTANSKNLPDYQNNCALFKIKKATAYLLRSTRKALSVSSLNFSKSRDVLIVHKKPKPFVSWYERLNKRDKIISKELQLEETQADTNETPCEDTSSNTGDESLVVENNTINEQVEEIPLSSIPYSNRLLAKSRALKDIRVQVNHNTSSQIICAPIVPDLVIQIQNAVNEKIEVPKIPEAVAILEPEPIKSADAPVEPIVVHPTVVKKLSFADYKKKMK